MELSTDCVRENHEEVFEVARNRRRVSRRDRDFRDDLRVLCVRTRIRAAIPGGRDAQRFPANRRRGNRGRSPSRADHGMHALPRRQSRDSQYDRHSGHRALCAAQYFANHSDHERRADGRPASAWREGRRDDRVAHACGDVSTSSRSGCRANPRLGAHGAGKRRCRRENQHPPPGTRARHFESVKTRRATDR